MYQEKGYIYGNVSALGFIFKSRNHFSKPHYNLFSEECVLFF